MNEYDKEIKEMQLKINFYNMQSKLERLQKLLGKNINKLEKFQEKPEKLAKMSPAQISNLVSEAIRDLKNYDKYANAFFVSYKKVHDLLFSETDKQSKNKNS